MMGMRLAFDACPSACFPPSGAAPTNHTLRMSFWEQLFRTKKQHQIRAAALGNTRPICSSHRPPPLERVLGALLENWEQRYTFALDREAGRLLLGRGTISL